MSNAEIGEVESGHVNPAPRKKADSSVLVKGCAIGCGAVGFLAILVLCVVYFFVWPSISSKMAKGVSTQLTSDFDSLKESGKVPEQDTELYQSLVDATQGPEVTLLGAMLATTIVVTNLDDGQVSETERQEAQDARELFEANPGAGIAAVNAFMAKHEGLQERFQVIQRSMNPSMLVGAE